ncbi:GMC oxidoreductase [Macrolepiota fuliginosa MF-IS2]|uniref:pyranose dehydrogenase (acceptor) n=1 Tax=Macrolepiota fuliginosa MF-IS2 TaxID=1400762 RepID=A0A9P5X4I0_9AGAR|nr:GMC oxidoreductase [Macrolepiota fuliginosa MF-IS2]
MFFKLLIVLALFPLTLCATWRSIRDVPKLNWDFIIVGGGTAGSVLAGRLTENPKFNVLVIEAGPTNEGVTESICPGLQSKLALTRYDWNFTTVSMPGYNNRSINYQRGHLLGGSSSVNGMVFTRGAASDYDRWAKVTGDAGWTWDNLQLYRERHEKFQPPVDNHNITGQFNPAVHSLNGTVPTSVSGFQHPTVDPITLQVAQELGGEFKFNLDFNSGMPLGVGWLQATIGHDGTRSSAATSYLTPQVQSRKNLHIVTDTLVTRVLQTSKGPSTDSPTIRTIEITSRDNSSDKVLMTASKEVILSGGSIGSPHILLSSGIGDRNDLEKLGVPVVLHNPSVGRNLTDHPSVNAVSFGLKPGFLDMGFWANLESDPNLQQQALALWEKNRTGPYTALVTSDHIGWVRIPDDSPIFEMFPDTSSGPTAAHIEMIIGASNNTTWEMRLRLSSPASRGSISLNSSNPLDAPLINPNFFSHPFDILAFLEAFRGAQRFVSAPVLKDAITGVLEPYTGATTDAEIENTIRENAVTAWHPIGTAAMSPKGASWGVVDPDLRVKGVNGLRIVDASIMPYIPCAHTQTAVYFIAERAADLVKEAWR